MKSSFLFAFFLGALLVLSAGCSRDFVGGAAVGAGATGATYEYQNKSALKDLERDFERGAVTKDEYLRRKKEIQDRSLIY